MVKVKEKKKDPITPNQNSSKSKKTPASHTGSQRSKNPEPVKAAPTRDASINKLRRNYRPQTAAVTSPKPTEYKPPKPAQGITKKAKPAVSKKKKATNNIADKKPGTH